MISSATTQQQPREAIGGTVEAGTRITALIDNQMFSFVPSGHKSQSIADLVAVDRLRQLQSVPFVPNVYVCECGVLVCRRGVFRVHSPLLLTDDLLADPSVFPGVSCISSRPLVGDDDDQLVSMSSLDDALVRFRRGDFVIVVDNEDRENEGDLIAAAECMTPEKMAFLVRHSTGIVCVPMLGSWLDRLGIPLMVDHNTDNHQTAFTVSVDASARHSGVTTGVSASDRSRTVNLLADPMASSMDFTRPGHVFPLRCRAGGVRERQGHTEAAVELCRLSGRAPVAVISEIVRDDGAMARRAYLMDFARRFNLCVISVQQLVDHVTLK